MNTATLNITNLHKSYGKKYVVKGVDFAIDQGQVVGFLGPNGAGKTTIFHMLVGFIKSDQGTIHLNNENINKYPIHKRSKIGITYLPQESSIFRKLTVRENIMGVLQMRTELTKGDKLEQCTRLMERFGITSLSKQRADTLSGGERRRTEIARALAINPKFLLLDEPFTGIDPLAVSDIKDIIQQLAELNIGVLITDHNARDTLEITNRSYIINNGVIIASGTSKELVNNPEAQKVYFGTTFKKRTRK